jgi:phosphate starvation-inducible protein PhoH and related proteins
VKGKEQVLTKFSVSCAGIDPVALLGTADENLQAISRHLGCQISARGDRIRVSAEVKDATRVKELLTRLVQHVKTGAMITPEVVQFEIARLSAGNQTLSSINAPPDVRTAATGEDLRLRRIPADRQPPPGIEGFNITTPRTVVHPKTPHQADYVRMIDDFDVVIAIGPAGTGKTYLAVAKAVAALVAGKVSRIVLTRPAVEAGESLGFLPGGFKEKVDPYLRPLYDALYDMILVERMKRLVDEQIIEVAPLAYMRGRTLSDSFVILDEAQNTTSAQMKMFLTRLGWNSKAIVTGDITQIDLDHRRSSGLVEVQSKLRRVPGISFCFMDDTDVVRPPIVANIIRAYEHPESADTESNPVAARPIPEPKPATPREA